MDDLPDYSVKKYKIKLVSGRIIGPIDINRIRKLVRKNQIVGKESARLDPVGEWKDINQFPEIAELLIAGLAGGLGDTTKLRPDSLGETVRLDTDDPEGDDDATVLLPSSGQTATVPLPGSDNQPDFAGSENQTGAKTKTGHPASIDPTSVTEHGALGSSSISGEKTLEIKKKQKKKKPGENKNLMRIGILAAIVLAILFSPDEDKKPERDKSLVADTAMSFKIPVQVGDKPDPNKSDEAFKKGLKPYLEDTVIGYRVAAKNFFEAASYDMNNVRALSLLASSYLNLVESSNKGANYFAAISKLIELTSTRKVDLAEVAIAETEFYLVIGKLKAAEEELLRYAKRYTPGVEHYYMMALVFYEQGDLRSAAKQIAQLPEDNTFGPRGFYLRGLIASSFGRHKEAIGQFNRNLEMFPEHSKSMLGLARALSNSNQLGGSQKILTKVIEHPERVSPIQLAEAHFLRARARLLSKNKDGAEGDLRLAAELDPLNHDYQLEYYAYQAKTSESKQAKKRAQAYLQLGEGEKLLKAGKYRKAIDSFLEARQLDSKWGLPLVKIGQTFARLGDYRNAKINLKQAMELGEKSVPVHRDYIHALIEGFDWEEAEKQMKAITVTPGGKNVVFQLAGDLGYKQENYISALEYYREAMNYENVDPSVYIGLAASLLKLGKHTDAQFYFTLARRFDPLNIDAIIGIAETIVNTESLERGVIFLENESKSFSDPQAGLYVAIGEMALRNGEARKAERYVRLAKALQPDYAGIYKLQAKLFLAQRKKDRKAFNKAIQSYDAYLALNPADAGIYLEKYRLFISEGQYNRAGLELDRLHGVFPRFPGLGYFRGQLYLATGEDGLAATEFNKELKQNPRDLRTIVALGKIFLKAGKLNEAAGHFNLAMQIAPEYADALHLSGQVNYLLKNYDGAIALLNRASKLDSGNPSIFKQLGLAYQAIGKKKMAAQAFQRYLQLNPNAPDRKRYEQFL